MELPKFDHPDISFFENTNLEKYTTIKLGNFANLIEVHSIEALKISLAEIKSLGLNFHIVGWGANQVLHNCEKTIFVKLAFRFDKKYLSQYREHYELPASVGLNQLTATAIKNGLKGWEVFTGIPASLGGAICMNAGTSLGEIGNLVKIVTILTLEGRIKDYYPDKGSFSYRKNNFLKAGEIIVGATLGHRGKEPAIGAKIKEYLQYRKETQPLGTKNCGSVFKNNSEHKAGQTIDMLGLKGYGPENLKVSLKHANFIENLGGAKSEQFIELVKELALEVERCTGQKFELEVKIY